jgi:hypothetical protein
MTSLRGNFLLINIALTHYLVPFIEIASVFVWASGSTGGISAFNLRFSQQFRVTEVTEVTSMSCNRHRVVLPQYQSLSLVWCSQHTEL